MVDFERREECWVTAVVLPNWARVALGGRLEVRAHGPEVQDLHHDAVAWLTDNEADVLDALLAAMHRNYASWREEYGYGPQDDAQMPVIAGAGELAQLMSRPRVHIPNVIAPDAPLFGVEMECRWDDEHGFGAAMHGLRVLRMGGADTAFLNWIFEREAANIRPNT